jgi:hypothetical protein
MKTLFLGPITAFGLIAGLTNHAMLAQSAAPKCTAEFLRSLTIRGLHLGMTTDEVLAFFAGASERQDIKDTLARANGYPSWGYAGLSFFRNDFYTALRKEQFEGVESARVSFFDGRLVSFSIGYPGYSSNGPAWDSVGQFVSKMAEMLHLPSLENWSKDNNSQMRIECGGPQINLYSSGESGSSITVSDSSFQSVIQEREHVRREKRRQEFKP